MQKIVSLTKNKDQQRKRQIEIEFPKVFMWGENTKEITLLEDSDFFLVYEAVPIAEKAS